MKDNVLPDFLGIGAMRCGTTLLYKILKSHNEIFVPRIRKEVHFFDINYKKGLKWYKSFFPSKKDARKYKAIGEITPRYIFQENVPRKVAKVLPDAKFIVILRNPVNRIYSHYKLGLSVSKKNISFEDFIKSVNEPFRRGLYSEQLKNWMKHFPRERFLILIFEEMLDNPCKALKQIAEFLNVDKNKFDVGLFESKSNYSYEPRFKKLYLIGFKFKNFLLRNDLDYMYSIVRKGKHLFRIVGKKADNIDADTRKKLYMMYEEDINELEKMLDINLSRWKIK